MFINTPQYRIVPLLSMAFIMTMLPCINIQASDDEVMMQAFYWDVPVDSENVNGIWWSTLGAKAGELAQAGFTSVWTPAPVKGAYSIYDMGYGVYDHYDLGEYKQKGNIEGVPPSVETRFGSKQELLDMVAAFQSNDIKVYSDIVLNHMYGGSFEYNPVVTQYIQDERYPTYPTSQVKWVVPDVKPGDYRIEVKGYNLNWDTLDERVYELHITWQDQPVCDDDDTPEWSFNLDESNDESYVYRGNNCSVYGYIHSQEDSDSFKITLNNKSPVTIRIYPRYHDDGVVRWNSDENGYRVISVHNNNSEFDVRAHTQTSFTFAEKESVPDLEWSYNHFNPSHKNDYLEDEGFEDEVRPNWMIYGVDLNSRDDEVRQRLIEWGEWLTNTVGFDGYRLDFVRGLEQDFVAEWLNAMPLHHGKRRFSVAEYWTYYPYRIFEWVGDVESYGAETAVFDFPLRDNLRRMCNDYNFDMRVLSTAGMIRDEQYALSSDKVVTFLENHDTGKEHDKWITRDWHMGYAYILFSDGIPCIFYPHYYDVEQVDMVEPERTMKAESGLREKIDELISIRQKYLAGNMEILTESGDPYPIENTKHIFAARRKGDTEKPGGILVLNNHPDDALGITLNVDVAGWDSLAGEYVMNITGSGNEIYRVADDGRVKLTAPPRGYAIFVLEDAVIN